MTLPIQDASRENYELVTLLARSTGASVVMIGDPNQNLYRFRNASTEYLLHHAAKSGGVECRLGTNWRSTPRIVALCSPFMRHPSGITAAPDARDGPQPRVHTFSPARALDAIVERCVLSMGTRTVAVVGRSKRPRFVRGNMVRMGLQTIVNELERRRVPYRRFFRECASDDGANDTRPFVQKGMVNMMTIHGSKGLEADVVIVIDALQDLVDGEEAPDSMELMYVALSRARCELDVFNSHYGRCEPRLRACVAAGLCAQVRERIKSLVFSRLGVCFVRTRIETDNASGPGRCRASARDGVAGAPPAPRASSVQHCREPPRTTRTDLHLCCAVQRQSNGRLTVTGILQDRSLVGETDLLGLSRLFSVEPHVLCPPTRDFDEQVSALPEIADLGPMYGHLAENITQMAHAEHNPVEGAQVPARTHVISRLDAFAASRVSVPDEHVAALRALFRGTGARASDTMTRTDAMRLLKRLRRPGDEATYVATTRLLEYIVSKMDAIGKNRISLVFPSQVRLHPCRASSCHAPHHGFERSRGPDSEDPDQPSSQRGQALRHRRDDGGARRGAFRGVHVLPPARLALRVPMGARLHAPRQGVSSVRAPNLRHGEAPTTNVLVRTRHILSPSVSVGQVWPSTCAQVAHRRDAIGSAHREPRALGAMRSRRERSSSSSSLRASDSRTSSSRACTPCSARVRISAVRKCGTSRAGSA